MSDSSAPAAAVDPMTVPADQERPAWMAPPSRILTIAKVVVLVAVVFAVVFPFLTVIATSLASDVNIIEAGGFVLFPKDPTLNAYRTIFQNGVVANAMLVSVGVTVVGTLVSLTMTTLMAYGLAQRRLRLRAVVYMVLFTMIFTPGIIPNYLIVRQLGLLDTYAALILPVMINAFNLVVMRQFFLGIPSELIDSARIDGAGELRILWSIVLPLSKPVIAVIGLFYAVAYWNAFFGALLYLNDNSSWPLQMIVRMYVLQGSSLAAAGAGEGAPMVPQSLMMAIVVCATIPILIVYPLLQRYFTAGVLSGAIKG